MKKYLSFFCALVMLTSLASCGDSASSSENMDLSESSITGTTVEEIVVEESTIELSKVLESSIAETTTAETVTEELTIEHSTEKDDFITVPDLYGIDFNEATEKYKDSFVILSYGREKSELKPKSIISQDIEAGTVYEFNGDRPRIHVKLSNGKKIVPLNEQELDKTYKSNGISFSYSSDWEEYDSKFMAPAFTIENNFRIITRYQTGEFGNISDEKYIEQKKQDFDKKNRPYEIVTNKNGDEIFSYLPTNFTKCFGCANGKVVFTIDFENYSEEYDDIINKIIDTVEMIPYGMSNPIKATTEEATNETTVPVTEPPTENPVKTQPPVIETSPVLTTVHFILNLETNCVHIDAGCRAAKKILPENYAEIDIAENDLASYNGVYWACGICAENYANALPKFDE